MKIRMNRLFSRMLSNKGYTIDQTILIVAIIAILITLVIITVGWTLINRTSGTKAGAQIKSVDEAVSQFYSQWKMWPQGGAYTGTVSADKNMQLLAGVTTGLTAGTGMNFAEIRNLVQGFKVNGTTVSHAIGGGGTVTFDTATVTIGTATEKRNVTQFLTVPYAEAVEANKNVDGNETATPEAIGNVRYGTGSCLPATTGGNFVALTAAASGNVTVCYIGAPMQ
jgi:Tfp pilus assembly protein PilE